MPCLELHILAVDGQTQFLHKTNNKKEVQEFLKHYDHEGSSVSLKVIFEDVDELYKFLESTT